VLLPAAVVESPHGAMLLLIASAAAFGCYSSNNWAVTQTLAGPGAAGKWSGIQNTFGNIAGVLAPRVTGFIVFKSGSFHWAFVLSATMLVLGACSFLFLIGKIAPLRWIPNRN
jgi:MFS transporter, ACS family, D-galactonate transporter